MTTSYQPRLGRELKRLRLRAKLTQRRACEAIWGTTGNQASWSRWERGKQDPQLSTIDEIAHFFGVSVSVFGVADARRPLTTGDLQDARELIERAQENLSAAMTILARAED